MFDLNFDPRIIDGLSLAAMAMGHDPKNPEWIDDRFTGEMQQHDPESFEDLGDGGVAITRKWAHVGVTVTLCIFLWGQYESSSNTRAAMQQQIAISTERIAELRDSNARQDEALRNAVSEMGRRLDIQRNDLRELQRQFNERLLTDPRLRRQ